MLYYYSDYLCPLSHWHFLALRLDFSGAILIPGLKLSSMIHTTHTTQYALKQAAYVNILERCVTTRFTFAWFYTFWHLSAIC